MIYEETLAHPDSARLVSRFVRKITQKNRI